MQNNKEIKGISTLILTNGIPFPDSIVTYEMDTRRVSEVVKSVLNDNKTEVFLIVRKNSEQTYVDIDSLYDIGVLAEIKQVTNTSNYVTRLVIKAKKRGRLIDFYNRAGELYFSDIEILEDELITGRYNEIDIMAMKESIVERYNELAKKRDMNTMLSKEIEEKNIETIISMVCTSVQSDRRIKQELLRIDSFIDRYYAIYELVIKSIKMIDIKRDIDEKVSEKFNKSQREYILKEQIKIIRQELGDTDPTTDYEVYLEKLDTLNLDNETKDKLADEIKKLKGYGIMSQESSMQKNYLETVFSYPWNVSTDDKNDISFTKDILNKEHYGLKQVKEKIIEYIAVRTFNPNGNLPILCLVGPPGTGKTSIANSIARSLGRKLVRVSLGGVKDESEIRGHRRTYLGSMPGRIVKGIIQAKTNNPVMLFDEIDKLGTDFRGDPSAALLEVFDYEQNKSFRDNYFELPVNLSKVLFITTANSLSTIPAPLLDRMEIIEVNSYTSNEKYHIAKDYLYPKQLKAVGLTKERVKVSDTVLVEIIKNYVREAGVRRLERKIGELLRKAAKYLLENDVDTLSITKKNIKEFLGNPRYTIDEANKKDSVGIVNGLAWTSVGGCVLQIEVSAMPGNGKLELTGQMGNVMKESALIAKSYLRSLKGKYSIPNDYFEKHNLHIHIPEGAVPKDGPSAGITMASAMLSAILDKKARADLCMTGEVTLRGRVLAIGGIKEKLLAGKQSGIYEVLVPFSNKKDIEELDNEITENMNIHYVSSMNEVLDYVFKEK